SARTSKPHPLLERKHNVRRHSPSGNSRSGDENGMCGPLLVVHLIRRCSWGTTHQELRMYFASLRATAVALLAGGLLLPAAAFAASDSTNTGTVVGTVTCGPAEEAPAAHIVVAAEGLNLQTLTSSDGRFTLIGLPASQPL